MAVLKLKKMRAIRRSRPTMPIFRYLVLSAIAGKMISAISKKMIAPQVFAVMSISLSL